MSTVIDMPLDFEPTSMRLWWENNSFKFGPSLFSGDVREYGLWGRWMMELSYDNMKREEGVRLGNFLMANMPSRGRAIRIKDYHRLLPFGGARNSHSGTVKTVPEVNAHQVITQWDVSTIGMTLFKVGDIFKFEDTEQVMMIEEDVVVSDNENVVLKFPQYVRTPPQEDEAIIVESVSFVMQIDTQVIPQIASPNMHSFSVTLREDTSNA